MIPTTVLDVMPGTTVVWFNPEENSLRASQKVEN